MQSHLVVIAGRGSVSDMKLCGGGCFGWPEKSCSVLVSQEQCGGAQRKNDSGMIEIKRSQSLFLREETLVLLGFAREASMTCSG
jgi:hypothetical protein